MAIFRESRRHKKEQRVDQSLTRQELLERLSELEREEGRRKDAERFAEAVLNSLSAHIAILDQEGVIIETNRAWKAFAHANAMRMRPDTLAVNYIQLCESSVGDSVEQAWEVARGIRAVIAGEIDEFVIDYPCHSPDEKRWFYMRATRLAGTETVRVVVSHENITALKQAEEALRRREAELEQQSRNLEEANTALKVLLQQREHDKRELEENVLINVRNFTFPYLEKLKSARLDPQYKAYLEIMESHLKEIVSPFLYRLSSQHLQFTPQEIQVAALVKDGRTTKDIAQTLSLSTNAVEFHRKNIRKKLGLNHVKTNLRSYLLSLSYQ
jgi:DNA-binding CsgD family transcriptional regulator